MKTGTKTTLIALTALTAGAIAGFSLPMFYLPANYPANIAIGLWRDTFMDDKANSVREKAVVLKFLRAGNDEKAIGLLEHEMDMNLAGLHASKDYSPLTNKLVQHALTAAAEDRKAHPRAMDNAELEAMVQQALNAQSAPSADVK